MSLAERVFVPTERMIVAKRQQLLDAAVAYVRDGRDGSMRDRLRTASSVGGVSIPHLEAEIGNIERIKINNERTK
jgi:hypothetical protein